LSFIWPPKSNITEKLFSESSPSIPCIVCHLPIVSSTELNFLCLLQILGINPSTSTLSELCCALGSLELGCFRIALSRFWLGLNPKPWDFNQVWSFSDTCSRRTLHIPTHTISTNSKSYIGFQILHNRKVPRPSH
jgi:hypothetical protein